MPTEPVSSPEEEVREIAERMATHLMNRYGLTGRVRFGQMANVLDDGIREAQRLATERAERECADAADYWLRQNVGRIHFYRTQETAMVPGIADGWPKIIAAPHTKNGRLKRADIENLRPELRCAIEGRSKGNEAAQERKDV